MTAFVGNTNVLDLIGLSSEIESAFINDATVEVTVKDAAGNEIDGQSWPTTMDYLAASDGNYRAYIQEDVEFVPKQPYYAHITADGGVNRVGHWVFPFKPLTRTGLET